MELIEAGQPNPGGDFVATYLDDDLRQLVVTITTEGVIIDVYEEAGQTLIDSKAMMADEWWDEIAGDRA